MIFGDTSALAERHAGELRERAFREFSFDRMVEAYLRRILEVCGRGTDAPVRAQS